MAKKTLSSHIQNLVAMAMMMAVLLVSVGMVVERKKRGFM